MKVWEALEKAPPGGSISSKLACMVEQTRDTLLNWLLNPRAQGLDIYRIKTFISILMADDWKVDKIEYPEIGSRWRSSGEKHDTRKVVDKDWGGNIVYLWQYGPGRYQRTEARCTLEEWKRYAAKAKRLKK